MKDLGSYPYRCPDCPQGNPFRNRAAYARHRQLRHSAPDVDPTLYDLEPAPVDLTWFERGASDHGTSALPTLDEYDGEVSRW